MASFRIYRMRPHVKQSFRWAPHVTGLATVKPRDYLPDGEFEAHNEYALWAELQESRIRSWTSAILSENYRRRLAGFEDLQVCRL